MAKASVAGYRFAAALWIPIVLLGWLWFAGSFGLVMSIYTPVILVALLIAAITPQSMYSSNYRLLLVAIYLVGIVMTIMAMYEDYTRSYGPEYDVMILRATQIFILGMLTKIALTNSKGVKGA